MTEPNERSLYEKYASTLAGAVELAAVELADQVAVLIRQALEASPRDQRDLAGILDVTEARISQVVNGDGNLRVGAVAKYLRALGYSTQLVAKPAEEGLPEIPKAVQARPRRRGTLPVPANRSGVISVTTSEDRPYVYTFEVVQVAHPSKIFFGAEAEPREPLNLSWSSAWPVS